MQHQMSVGLCITVLWEGCAWYHASNVSCPNQICLKAAMLPIVAHEQQPNKMSCVKGKQEAFNIGCKLYFYVRFPLSSTFAHSHLWHQLCVVVCLCVVDYECVGVETWHLDHIKETWPSCSWGNVFNWCTARCIVTFSIGKSFLENKWNSPLLRPHTGVHTAVVSLPRWSVGLVRPYRSIMEVVCILVTLGIEYKRVKCLVHVSWLIQMCVRSSV